MNKKNIKRYISVLLILCLGISALLGCNNKNENMPDEENSYSGNITIWSWNEELLTSGIIDKFNEKYPNININLVTIPNDNNAYLTKLTSTLRSGVNAPDIYLAESASVKNLCNMSYYENLSEDPYNAEDLTKKMVPYTVDLGRNDKDNSIRALTWQATPGGYFYKRSLAKQYLGTDNPEEVQKMMTTMDDFLAMGEKIKTESNGETTLLANYSELLYVVLANRKQGWVENNKLVIDPIMSNYIDLAEQIRNKGLDINAKQWTPKWTESMKTSEVFGFMLPTWGLSSTLQSNAPDTKGDWGFVKAPSPYYWGGTWIGMYKNSNNKDLSWLFIKFLTTDEDFLSQYAKDSGDFVNNTDIQNEISNSTQGENEFLNGQNVYKSYTDLVGNINAEICTQYDEIINNAWSNVLELFMNGKITKEEIIPNFKQAVKDEYPSIEVD